MKTKSKSKYIPNSTIIKLYETLEDIDLILFKILHRTGIRISEVKQYVETITPDLPYVNITPAKKNNDRILPIVLTQEELDSIKTISLNAETLKQRIRRWELGFSAHDLRATFITNALDKDISPAKVMRLTGHKNLKSLMAYNRIQTENSLWLYDFITSTEDSWNKLDDVDRLKDMVKANEKTIAILKYKNEMLDNKNKKLTKKLKQKGHWWLK